MLARMLNNPVVQKAKRYNPWKPKETVSLVQDYLVCGDELSALKQVFQKKLDFFNRLAQDIEEQDEEDENLKVPVHDKAGETSKARVNWAVAKLQEDLDSTDRLLTDLMKSLDTVSKRPRLKLKETTD